MKAGFSLLIRTTRPGRDDLDLLQALKAAGYEGAEIPVSPDAVGDMALIRQMLDDCGLAATASGGVTDPARNPMSDDPTARRAGVDDLKRLVDGAVVLGAEVLSGPFHQPLAQFSGTGPTDREKAALVEAHRAMADHAAGAVRLAIEPLNRFECYALNTCDQAAALVADVNRPGYGYLYDTFHAHIEERDPTDAIQRTGAAIGHVHISENDRGIPGTGQVDFNATARALRSVGYDGWLVVEAFGQALPDLAAATRIWRPLFESEADVIEGGITTIRMAWDNAARAGLKGEMA